MLLLQELLPLLLPTSQPCTLPSTIDYHPNANYPNPIPLQPTTQWGACMLPLSQTTTAKGEDTCCISGEGHAHKWRFRLLPLGLHCKKKKKPSVELEKL